MRATIWTWTLGLALGACVVTGWSAFSPEKSENAADAAAATTNQALVKLCPAMLYYAVDGQYYYYGMNCKWCTTDMVVTGRPHVMDGMCAECNYGGCSDPVVGVNGPYGMKQEKRYFTEGNTRQIAYIAPRVGEAGNSSDPNGRLHVPTKTVVHAHESDFVIRVSDANGENRYFRVFDMYDTSGKTEAGVHARFGRELHPSNLGTDSVFRLGEIVSTSDGYHHTVRIKDNSQDNGWKEFMVTTVESMYPGTASAGL